MRLHRDSKGSSAVYGRLFEVGDHPLEITASPAFAARYHMTTFGLTDNGVSFLLANLAHFAQLVQIFRLGKVIFKSASGLVYSDAVSMTLESSGCSIRVSFSLI